MIVIDSSALLAILFSEPEKGAFEGAIKGARRCLASLSNDGRGACNGAALRRRRKLTIR